MESDVDRIVAIHKAALGANLMLYAQFPTAFSRGNLWIIVAEKSFGGVQDPEKAGFVVRDQNEIISLATWNRPVFESEDSEDFLSRCPEGNQLSSFGGMDRKGQQCEAKSSW